VAWQGAPVADRLRPGLSDVEIDEVLGPLGIDLPEEARVWWKWHDGADPDGDRWISPRAFAYVSLGEATLIREEVRQQAQRAGTPDAPPPMDEPDYWWAPSWFPLGSSGGTVACDYSVARHEPSPIRVVDWWDEEFHRPKAASLGQMVSWWIDAFDRGAWYFDRERGVWDGRREMIDREMDLSRLL